MLTALEYILSEIQNKPVDTVITVGELARIISEAIQVQKDYNHYEQD